MATSWRARALKAVLNTALEQSGMSAREVARQLGISHTKVNRWLGDDGPAPNGEDTAAFLARLEVTGPERDRILAIARTADTDLIVSGPPGINPHLATVLECERFATKIFEFNLVWWPGLLQCSDYARMVISRDGSATQTEIETRVLVRNARRDLLTRRRNPVQFDAVISPAAVRGGFVGADVRAAQLEHARDLAKLDNVTVQVARVGDDWTPSAPFIVYEFGDDMPTTVYLEGSWSSTFIVDADVVRNYQAAAETLRREAMSPEDTAELIADAIPNGSLETTE
jgi:AcrR family transcriptional regulator